MELFEQGKRPTVAASDRLPAAWNTSFKRALDGLAERGQRRLIVERRHLETLEEFVAALSGQEPRRRHAAAAAHPGPVLAAIVRSGKHAPRYTPVENEDST